MRRLARAFTGELLDTTNHLDKGLAGLGATLAIAAVLAVSGLGTPGGAAGLALISIGASAVLLFAVPHGALSQPWPVLGGHLVSALIGVSCALYVPTLGLAAALTVSLSIMAMHYLRCIHPPGGATALFAVLGGESITALGYGFVLHPVFSSAAVMLAITVVFNYPFGWRRYPAVQLHASDASNATPTAAEVGFSPADLEHAMREMNLIVSMTEEDLARLYLLAKRHHEQAAGLAPAEIEPGQCYSNGRVGTEWSVRKVLGTTGPLDEDRIVYRAIGSDATAGHQSCSRADFARWACYRVESEGRMCETMLDRLQAANAEPVPGRAS